MSKQNRNRLTDTGNRRRVPEGREVGGRLGKNGERIKKYNFTVTDQSRVHKAQLREHSEQYCRDCVGGWVGVRLIGGRFLSDIRCLNTAPEPNTALNVNCIWNFLIF